MADIKIEGYEGAMEILNRYPDNSIKAVKAAMRNAVKPILSNIKSQAPSAGTRKIVKAKFVRSDNLSLLFGFYGNKRGNKGSREVPDWFKAYWINYGTLKMRYAGHKFQFPVKRNTFKRSAGIKPRLYFEAATEGKEGIILQNFNKELEIQVKKIIENG